MHQPNNVKEVVRQKYGEIALQSTEVNKASCCGAGSCSIEVYNIMSDDYAVLDGYHAEADLGLGCGLPTQFANLQPGQTVIDLGSGAGNDAFVALKEVGDTGKVIGIDFTPAMVEKARANAAKLGYTNVVFVQADIEQIPLMPDLADVIVSNCVLNLVPNKDGVFKEIFRTLKPGGHFSISDVVLQGELPENLRNAAEMYAGCVSGAIQQQAYLALIADNGFVNIAIQKTKQIVLPNDVLSNYLSQEELEAFKAAEAGIYSITVYAEKPVN